MKLLFSEKDSFKRFYAQNIGKMQSQGCVSRKRIEADFDVFCDISDRNAVNRKMPDISAEHNSLCLFIVFIYSIYELPVKENRQIAVITV